jgi:hypothetical protein
MSRQPEGFAAIARRAIARGEGRVLPIAVGGKQPLIKWKDSDLDILPETEWLTKVELYIDQIAKMFPNSNCCVIAKPSEKCFIDEDSDDFRTGFEAWAGVPFSRTFTTSAREGHKQSHWLQTDKTRALGNVTQEQTANQILSFRQHNYYVLSEGSQYKDNVRFYDVVDDSPTVPMPDRLVEYLEHLIALKDMEDKKNAKSTTDTAPRNERGLVPKGSVHGYMLSEAGHLRDRGYGEEVIRAALRELVEKNVEPPIDWDKVDAMAKSISTIYPEGQSKAAGALAMNQTADPQAQVEKLAAAVLAKSTLDSWLADDSTVTLTQDEVFSYCGVLSESDYETYRKRVTKKLGWARAATLDSEREKHIPEIEEEDENLQGQAVVIENVPPLHVLLA